MASSNYNESYLHGSGSSIQKIVEMAEQGIQIIQQISFFRQKDVAAFA